MNGPEAIERLLRMPFLSVLDIGSGDGHHADIFRLHGKQVTTVDLGRESDYQGRYEHMKAAKTDCVWACHVLEHQPNVNLFLSKCFYDLKDDGIMAVTVPPMKSEIVGGHLTLWNAGLLLYNLILAGFDCSKAAVKTYGYNVSVIVKKQAFQMPKLKMDHGDIEALSQYFPLAVVNGFDGNIQELNW